MTFKKNKNNSKKKFNKPQKGSSSNGAAPNKFLYQRQENRKKQIKNEEELWESVSDSEENQEGENVNEHEAQISGSAEEEQDFSENSDSNSENEIYKDDQEDNLLNLNSDNLEQIKISSEEKEKINSLFLDSIESCKDLKKKIDYTADFIKNPNNETKFGLSFLDSKNGLMIMYETYMLLYSMMKMSGVKIEKNLSGKEFDFNKDKNVLKNLITCRTFLEKIKSIDIKLKSQVERFMKFSEQDADETNETEAKEGEDDEEENVTAMRPKILYQEDESEASDIESDDDQNAEKKRKSKAKAKAKKTEEGSGDESKGKAEAKKNMKYQVKKNFQEFFETNEDNKKRQKKLSKLKEKIKNSEYYSNLKEEFTDKPKEYKSESTHVQNLMQQVEDYEDETMQRIKIPKREIKLARKRDREEFSLKDLGQEFKQFDRILKNDVNDELNEHQKHNKFKQINVESGFGNKKHHFNKSSNRGGKNFKKFKHK